MYATGTVALQRENVYDAVTYSAVGASTTTLAIGNDWYSPLAGPNQTLTKSVAGRFTASADSHTALQILGHSATQSGNIFEIIPDGSTNATMWFSQSTGLSFADTWGIQGVDILPISTGTFIAFGAAYDNNAMVIRTSTSQSVLIGSGLSHNAFIGGALAVMPLANAVGLVIRGSASRTAELMLYQTSAGGSLGNVSGGCIADVIADVSTTHTDGTFDTLATDYNGGECVDCERRQVPVRHYLHRGQPHHGDGPVHHRLRGHQPNHQHRGVDLHRDGHGQNQGVRNSRYLDDLPGRR